MNVPVHTATDPLNYGPLYRSLLTGSSLDDVLGQVCTLLASALCAPLVLVCRRLDSGVVWVKAASEENALWTELQRLPERWDDTIAGSGPAGSALRKGGPAWLRIADDGLLPWRHAATIEGVTAAGAWPLSDGHVLEIFAQDDSLFRESAQRQVVDNAAIELAVLLEHARRLAHNDLLAHALEYHASPALITDIEGSIVWVNAAFTLVYGYSAAEMIGQNPRMIQSGEHGLRYYRDLWDTVRCGRAWRGETVDRTRDGALRTVRQTISPFGYGELITHFLAVHEDITEFRRRQRERDLRAQIDPLTGLMTRDAFEQSVAAAIETQSPVALIALSLPGASQTLRSLGSKAFDEVLLEIGTRLRDVLGGADACMGAPGEYQIILKGEDERNRGAAVERIAEALARPFPLIGELDLQPRFGVACHPLDGSTHQDLLRHADRQLIKEPHVRARRRLSAHTGEH